MKILIADDHKLFREGLCLLIASRYPDSAFVTADSLPEASAALSKASNFDLIILDLHMPGIKGLDSITETCSANPNTPVMVVSGDENASIILSCQQAGVSAYVPKSYDGEVILNAIQSVLDGGTFFPRNIARNANDPLNRLTRRKRDILALLATGHSNKQIAEKLDLTEGTIKQYVSDILQELGVANRTQAGLLAREMLLIPDQKL